MANRLTIVQVSDTHLSRSHAWFTANWPVFVEEMRQLSPDFIINSGDISFNGPDRPDDLAFAVACHRELSSPWRAIAGNHDVGEAPVASRLNQPVNDARLAAWRSHVGLSWWVQDLEKDGLRLRLIGLDSALMGSGHEEEAVQAAFLETALAERDGRLTMVFTHMPPFDKDPDDQKITTHCILPEPRRWLLDRCLEHGVAVLAAGHIHRHTVHDYKGLAIVTAPATSFVNMPASPPSDISHMRTGYLLWHLDADGLRHQVVRPRLFISIDASNWTEQAKTTTSLPERPLQPWFG
ncbi:metallophosphoesterase [Rhizobium sp. RU36D]|uniref:metallophosphoesterase family protein n=1 Tax=Rhizobium sp. RU36D TaxID=1907415 RepID=UPI0009D8F0F2|nr:metallophosphoesterase [Rhizobium sp. RU36D]SMC70917.1 3',5'-cyclic AMP phosphodiesterase CpdA [Rhizobium sp. RU36D]